MKSILVLSIIVSLLLIGCGGRDDSKDIDATLRKIAEQQSKGLQGATTVVHRAYTYGKGFASLSPEEGSKLVAVDAEFTGAGEGFDLDDVDLVNGETGENYGSFPDIAFLNSKGEFLSFELPDVGVGSSIRVLLIYSVPANTTSIKLSYWGTDLTTSPVQLNHSGPELPEPKREEDQGQS